MVRLHGAGLDAVRGLVQEALDIVESGPALDHTADVQSSLRRVLAAVERLSHPSRLTSSEIAVADVCRFLMIRGEGLARDEFERRVGLPRETFHRLERAASKPGDLTQIESGIAAALRRLDRRGRASRLLTTASARVKLLAQEIAVAAEAATDAGTSSSLKIDDACRVLERLFRFEGAASIEAATGVRREIIEQMRSAAAFVGKREGWGDIR